MVNEMLPALMLRSLTKPSATMSRWRSGSWTAFRASSTRACSTAMTLRVSYAEERLAPLVEQHPQGVNAERRAERQEQQVDRAGQDREQPGPGAVFAERHADEDVRDAPEDRDDRERDEDRGGESGGDVAAPRGGGGQRHGADAERERRDADHRDERAPDHEKNGDEVDVRFQSRRAIPGWRCAG